MRNTHIVVSVIMFYTLSVAPFMKAQSIWEPIAVPGQMNAIGITSTGSIFATTTNRVVFRSDNNGATWVSLYTLSATPSMFACASNGNVFLGTQGQGLLRSTDNGSTWTMISGGIPDREVRDVALGAGGIIYAGTFTAGIFRSTDDGVTWTAMNNGLAEKDIASITVTSTGRVLVGVKGVNGLYKSDDHGNTWSPTGMPRTTRVFHIAEKANGILFADSDEPADGIYRSTDNGDTWLRIAFAGQNTGLHPQSIDAYGNVYVGVRADGHLYRSTDNGDSWNIFDSGMTGTPIGALISPNGYGFAASSTGFFRSSSTLTSVERFQERSPFEFELSQNYPNPFNPSTMIRYAVPEDATVTLQVYNMLGEAVAELVSGEVKAGYHEALFDATGLASGSYVYRLTATTQSGEKLTASKTLVVAK